MHKSGTSNVCITAPGQAGALSKCKTELLFLSVCLGYSDGQDSAPVRNSLPQPFAMHLLPREIERLQLYSAGNLAQKRLARGLRLNLVESTALIATVLQELIRDGNHSVAELMSIGKCSSTGTRLARCP